MVSLPLILAFVGLASAADSTGPNILQGDILLPDNVSNLGLGLNARSSSCRTSQVVCDSKFCAPTGSQCCGRGDGAYCDQGKQCVDSGCCENGKTCTGPPTKCDTGKVFCGEYCIPQDAVCCHNQGIYCLSGESCTTDGRCKPGSESRDDTNSTSAVTSSQDPSPSASSSASTAPVPVTTTTKVPSSSSSSSPPSSSSSSSSSPSSSSSSSPSSPSSSSASSSDNHSTTSAITTSVAPVTTSKVTSNKPTTTQATTSDVPATTEQAASNNPPAVTSSPSTHQAPSGEITTINETITGDSDTATDGSSQAASSSDTFVGQTTLSASHVTATTTVMPSESQPTDFTTGGNKDGAGIAHRPSLFLGLLALLPWVF